MHKVWAIYRRELAYFFNSPVAYAVITVFLLLGGYYFYNLLAYFNLASIQAMQSTINPQGLGITTNVIRPLFGNFSVVLLLILPLLTMRVLSEERRSGTAELLFTFPISDWDAILGKYLATGTVYAVMLAMTGVFPLLLGYFATPEVGPIVSGYLGLFLMGMSFVAMGMFFSSLGESQLVVGVMTFGCGLLFLMIGWITPFVSPVTASVIGQLSILEHYANFAMGIIDSNDVVYYINFSAFFLFLCARVLESNRWRS